MRALREESTAVPSSVLKREAEPLNSATTEAAGDAEMGSSGLPSAPAIASLHAARRCGERESDACSSTARKPGCLRILGRNSESGGAESAANADLAACETGDM